MTPIDKVLKRFDTDVGGLAAMLGYTYDAVYKMKARGGRLSSKAQLRIIQYAKQHKIMIKPSDLL